MLSAADNEVLCRVGPGTLMGNLIRQYWIPALRSEELPGPDCDPVRVRLLGENLVAFRDTSGRIGLIANACPHRRVSLFFGRNEENGLRCVYHGWKFDVTGQCVDMPNEPAESNFRHKVRTTAYPCCDRNGIIWAYMGPEKEPPPLPDIEPNLFPADQVQIWTAMRTCNWVQALEGDIDTSHLGFLHLGKVSPDDLEPGSFDYYTVKDRAPLYAVENTDFGTSYGAYRPATEDTYYWRIAHFLFPFFTMIPTGVLGTQVLVRAWVPLDDEHTMFWSIGVPGTRLEGTGGQRTDRSGRVVLGTAPQIEMLENTSDWFGRWRIRANKDNDYLIDRQKQRTKSFTGIDGIFTQDQAVTESMGTIVDREAERLGVSDTMVLRMRRRLLNAARAFAEGKPAPVVNDPEAYRVRSGGAVLPRTADWLEATAEARHRFAAPVGER